MSVYVRNCNCTCGAHGLSQSELLFKIDSTYTSHVRVCTHAVIAVNHIEKPPQEIISKTEVCKC